MRRVVVLGALVVLGTLSVAAAGLQQPPAPKVIEVEKLSENLFVLRGAGGGGNTAVLVGATGVTLVDTKNPGWGQPIIDKVRELTPKPVVRIINTHTHGDHVSGNVEFPATVDVVVQENTKANMEKLEIFKTSGGRGLPKQTFKDKLTIGTGAEQIDLYYFGRGHTNGDTFVVFPQNRVAHAGDIFSGKNLPLIDTANGGSAVQIADSLQKAYTGIRNVDRVITGHNAVFPWADLAEYAAFNRDVVAWARAQKAAGKTAEQAAAEFKAPEKYKGYSSTMGQLMGGLPGYMQRVYDGI